MAWLMQPLPGKDVRSAPEPLLETQEDQSMTELAAWFFAIAVIMALASLTGLAGVASGIAQILSAAFALFCLLALLFRGPGTSTRHPRSTHSFKRGQDDPDPLRRARLP